jgi:threonine dehydratase
MDDLLRRSLDSRVAEVLPEPTPLDHAPLLSERLGSPIFIKREDLTPVFSFKIRGAYNRMSRLDAAERAAGVVAASAGNHAQGVSFAARRLGIPCRIVMPRTTPSIKVEAVRRYGVAIELVGDDYTAAAEHAAGLVAATGAADIPPFDDLDVIAGQGTIALELLRQAPRDLGAIFVPVGGGGLAAGIATIVKALRPSVRVVGVQADDSDAMAQSLRAGHRVALPHVGIFADGVAARQVGEHTFALCRRYLDDCITVSVDEICAGIKDGFEETRVVLEPAGALAIAGAKRWLRGHGHAGGPAVVVASGANITFTRLRYVTEVAEVGERREAILAVTIPERPGAFLAFCTALEDRAVTEFNYRLSARNEAHVFVGVRVAGREEVAALGAELTRAGYASVDLTDDDLAKTHVRHMVGGRAAAATEEALFTFEFPERPGALRQFLQSLGARWNISLFHYRNHGAAFGRVLCGFEVPAAERSALRERLDQLGFAYREESDNPAVRLFL